MIDLKATVNHSLKEWLSNYTIYIAKSFDKRLKYTLIRCCYWFCQTALENFHEQPYFSFLKHIYRMFNEMFSSNFQAKLIKNLNKY